jgi:dipeptidyl-peptidase-4
MFDYPDIYQAGVSICGNHDNRFNTACWADRYCGPTSLLPEERYSNLRRAAALQGRLFLISGDMDQNVHVSQTLRLADALIRAEKTFDMLIVPNGGHDVMFLPYVQQRIWTYFCEHLRLVTPGFPGGFSFSEEQLRRAAIVAASEIPQ